MEDLNALTIKTLKQHLAARKLPTTGAKAILVHRLYNAIQYPALSLNAVSSLLAHTNASNQKFVWNPNDHIA